MRNIVYYVASSIDGFICGPADDISGFVPGGDGIEKYHSDLTGFDTVIMGRNTYEFGYRYGLTPGQPAYPHMKHYIFSNSLFFDNPHPAVHVVKPGLEEIRKIREETGTDIYLCGGGQFAGWLLDHEQITTLKIKLNPFIQGSGKRLFGDSIKRFAIEHISTAHYQYGLHILTYRILYV